MEESCRSINLTWKLEYLGQTVSIRKTWDEFETQDSYLFITKKHDNISNLNRFLQQSFEIHISQDVLWRLIKWTILGKERRSIFVWEEPKSNFLARFERQIYERTIKLNRTFFNKIKIQLFLNRKRMHTLSFGDLEQDLLTDMWFEITSTELSYLIRQFELDYKSTWIKNCLNGILHSVW